MLLNKIQKWISEAKLCLVSNKKHFLVLVIWKSKGKFSDGDGDFSKSPYLNFNDDKLKFDTNDVSNANDNYGSASAFLPKFFLIYQNIFALGKT